MTEVSTEFTDLPPFPSVVETAPLLRISLQKLIDAEPAELDRLWDACRNVGFFYLDLRGAIGSASASNSQKHGHSNGHVIEKSAKINGTEFISMADELFNVSKKFYELPVSEKLKYDFKEQGIYHGYKGLGAGLIDKAGTKDRNEFYNISKDDILNLSQQLPSPDLLEPYRPLLKSYIETSHAIVTLLLGHLNNLLHLNPSTLTSLHALHSHSGDQVRFVRSPPQPQQDRRAALGAHTDFGSMTLLFNKLGGLQILPPETDGLGEEEKVDKWQYVQPLKGHCVVNLGDAMVMFTRGVLRSNIHRVVNPPGLQGDMVRYSLVYFARASDDVLLRALEGSSIIDEKKIDGQEENGEVVSSKEWILRRALGRRGVGDWAKSEGTEGIRGMREVKA